MRYFVVYKTQKEVRRACGKAALKGCARCPVVIALCYAVTPGGDLAPHHLTFNAKKSQRVEAPFPPGAKSLVSDEELDDLRREAMRWQRRCARPESEIHQPLLSPPERLLGA